MTTPISPQRIAEIRHQVEAYQGSGIIRTRPGSAIAHRAELLAEVDRLNRLLAETRTEWGVEWGTLRSVYPYDDELSARTAAAGHESHVAVRRLVGPWTAAEPTMEAAGSHRLAFQAISDRQFEMRCAAHDDGEHVLGTWPLPVWDVPEAELRAAAEAHDRDHHNDEPTAAPEAGDQ